MAISVLASDVERDLDVAQISDLIEWREAEISLDEFRFESGLMLEKQMMLNPIQDSLD